MNERQLCTCNNIDGSQHNAGQKGQIQEHVLFDCIYIKLKKYFIYLFLVGGEGRGIERERNIDVREKHQLAASHMPPTRGPGPQPRHMP